MHGIVHVFGGSGLTYFTLPRSRVDNPFEVFDGPVTLVSCVLCALELVVLEVVIDIMRACRFSRGSSSRFF